VGSVARECDTYVAFGICERHPDIPAMIYNSAILIGPKGELVGVQRKIHIPGEERHFFAPGNCINVFKTQLGIIGLLICYDAFFPEIPRIQSLMGAEVICGLFNVQKKSTRSPSRLHYLAATRANENMNFFICCNRVGQQGEKSYLGHSAVGTPPGELLTSSTNDGEEMISVILDRDLVIRERAARPVFRDRRADLYSKICEL
jgi:predicted amidohydrolase